LHSHPFRHRPSESWSLIRQRDAELHRIAVIRLCEPNLYLLSV
jgi:hypothetical protein